MPLHLSLESTDGGLPNRLRAQLKLTYGLHGRRPAPQALIGKDVFDQSDFRSDFWPGKTEVDVVVLGHAYARGSVREHAVDVRVGTLHRRLTILGDRQARLVGHRVEISDPSPFERMPVTRDRAYGGTDRFVETSQADIDAHGVAVAFDHPGMYPRNPHGRGYAVTAACLAAGISLPNVEWSDRMIPSDAWLRSAPDAWPAAELPACIDFMPPQAFPRRACFGDRGAWHSFRLEDTREVERARIGTPRLLGISGGAAQEAWPGMTLDRIAGGEQVVIAGMHPAHSTIAFELPRPPDVTVTEKGLAAEVMVRAETLVIHPEEETYTIVFGAEATLRKRYVPYAANVADIGLRINGGPVVRLPVPTTPNLFGARP